MATLTDLEVACAASPSQVRARVAGALSNVRGQLAVGYPFAEATARTMARPEHSERLASAPAVGWTQTTDLRTLSGP